MSVVPSAAVSALPYSLSTGKVTRILNPQNAAGRVNGVTGLGVHLGPRPASAGEVASTPVSMASTVPSAAMTASRLMVISSSLWQGSLAGEVRGDAVNQAAEGIGDPDGQA